MRSAVGSRHSAPTTQFSLRGPDCRPSAFPFSKCSDLPTVKDEARAPEKEEARAAAAQHGAARAGLNAVGLRGKPPT